MKIFISSLFLVFGLLFSLFFIVPVQAKDVWVENLVCDSSANLYAFASPMVRVSSPWDDSLPSFRNNAIVQKNCVLIGTNGVGALWDYNESGGKLDKSKYCPYGTTAAVDAVGSLNKKLVESDSYACCPGSKQFLVSDWTGDPNWVNNALNWYAAKNKMCCETQQKPSNANTCGNGQPKADPVAAKVINLGDSVFPPIQNLFSCPNSSCLMKGGALSKDPRINLNLTKKNLYQCFETVNLAKPSPNLPNGDYCVYGDVFSSADFTKYEKILNSISTCRDLPTADETKSCLTCYKHCEGQTECSVIYNALGCMNTTISGLITRVMQIGIGVIGIVGIVQIMNAAMLRQTGDPAKIKESYDIIIAVLMGSMLLLGATVVLKLIGVDILGLLMFDLFA